jgi:hypothetical protein
MTQQTHNKYENETESEFGFKHNNFSFCANEKLSITTFVFNNSLKCSFTIFNCRPDNTLFIISDSCNPKI